MAPQLAEGHTSFGEILKGYEWDWPQAEQRYLHALTLNPHHAPAHHCYAQLLVSLRRYDEAVSHIEQARRADPVSPAINSYLPYIYLAARRYEHARREGERAVDLEPHAPLAHYIPTRYGDDVVVETTVSEIKRSSFSIEHHLFKDGKLAAEGFETRVSIERDPSDPDKIKSTPIPTAVVERLSIA